MTRGADRQYTSRKPLDAASVDRFLFISIDYDESVEERAAMAEYKSLGGKFDTDAISLINKVQTLRKAAKKAGITHPITPRASIMGVKMLTAGWPFDRILKAAVYKGMPDDQIKQLEAA